MFAAILSSFGSVICSGCFISLRLTANIRVAEISSSIANKTTSYTPTPLPANTKTSIKST